MRDETTNDTTTVASIANLSMTSGGVWSAHYRDGVSSLQARPRIADDPIALAAAGELLNRGCVVELHPEDVMTALGAGLALARLERQDASS